MAPGDVLPDVRLDGGDVQRVRQKAQPLALFRDLVQDSGRRMAGARGAGGASCGGKRRGRILTEVQTMRITASTRYTLLFGGGGYTHDQSLAYERGGGGEVNGLSLDPPTLEPKVSSAEKTKFE